VRGGLGFLKAPNTAHPPVISELVRLSMARGPVKRRFWRNMIDSRSRPRVEDGLRPNRQYEVQISQRRRAAMIEEIQEPNVSFDMQMLMTQHIPWQEHLRRVRVRFDSKSHFPENPMGWVLAFRRLTGEMIWIPLRIIRRILYLDRPD
jgi:hypothetical protein